MVAGGGTSFRCQVVAYTFGHARAEMMQLLQVHQGQVQRRGSVDSYATTLLQDCVGELEAASVSTHSGEEEDRLFGLVV
eukprot:4215877-Amphidinium_carterae.1